MTSLPTDDAARWREFVALARDVFDQGDAWGRAQSDPVPALFPAAEGWATAPLIWACGKGRIALERGDIAGAVLALVEAGHVGRNLELVERIFASAERVGKERARRAGRTRRRTLEADRDRKLLAFLANAPATYRRNPHAAARWLWEKGHTKLTRGQVERRLRKYPEMFEDDVAFLRNAVRRPDAM
jgi:hypothetical protein